MRRAIAVLASSSQCSVPVAAQWPKYQAPGVPRDAERRRSDGRSNAADAGWEA